MCSVLLSHLRSVVHQVAAFRRGWPAAAKGLLADWAKHVVGGQNGLSVWLPLTRGGEME